MNIFNEFANSYIDKATIDNSKDTKKKLSKVEVVNICNALIDFLVDDILTDAKEFINNKRDTKNKSKGKSTSETSVIIPRLGRLKVFYKSARTFNLPNKDAEYTIPESCVLKFVTTSKLKDQLSEIVQNSNPLINKATL